MSNTALVLRTCAADGSSYKGFRWPLTVGAIVEAPDWDHTPQCGNGLHGALHGEGDGGLFNWDADAVWMVVEVDTAWIVDLIGKVKFPACVIRFVGDRKGATDYIMANNPLARCVIGATVTGGDYATVTGGYRATVTGGDYATVTGGCSAIVTGGCSATVTGGNSATVTGGNSATVTGGCSATVTGGYRATVTGGNSATVTGGYRATVTGGNYATVTGGYDAILQIKWYDDNRCRIATAYVGEDGILPDVAYLCDNNGKLVRAK